MEKKLLLGVSISAVVLLVLASLSNVVGYETVQSSHQKTIGDVVDQKELLFQTIVDIVNNKEIKGIILRYLISRGEFLGTSIPVLTMKQLKQMYFIGLMLSKTISKSKMHSMLQTHQLITPEIKQEINAVIEKDTSINKEIKQLSSSECDCEFRNTTNLNSTGLCILLFPLYVLLWLYAFGTDIVFEILKLDMNNRLIFILYIIILFPYAILYEIGTRLNCFWGWNPYPSTTR